MTNNVFDFKICDELKKMPEYKFLRKEYSCTSQILSDKGRKVTLDMVIDMIVYSSRGDKELAIRGLRTSKDFVKGAQISFSTILIFLAIIFLRY